MRSHESELTANAPYIIEEFQKKVNEAPNEIFLVNPATKAVITRHLADTMSGRLYAYLKNKGIGKECRVMICLPRGELCYIAALGILKAGAAFTIVEDNYVEERINFIRNDFECELFLDMNIFNNAMCEESLKGFEKASDRDLCFAVYTSGTTGNPKGVLHEYGTLKLNYLSYLDSRSMVDTLSFSCAVVPPLNFAASIMYMIQSFYWCDETHIIPYSTVKNPELLTAYFRSKEIASAFMPASLFRVIRDMLDFEMKLIVLIGEPNNGVYIDHIPLYNLYAMSETIFAPLGGIIDKMYDICPVGKPTFDLPVILLDESGKAVADGETGELCFFNPFFRGYANLPEKTEKVFEYGVYHSGDMAVKTDDGRYIVKGRNDDMIKINGNRIEPAEIESAAKQILGIDWCGVKGFADDSRSYLCLYYTEELSMDTQILRSELEKRLPYYMIPTYYIKIDSVPTNANGKFSRKNLPKPDISEYFKEYAAPTNELEKNLCELFEEILSLSHIGINDDFFDLGGDSLSAMQLASALDIDGITAMDIFRERTPAGISRSYAENRSADDISPEQKELAARKGQYPLTAFQLNMFDYQLYNPKSCTWNLPVLFTFDNTAIDTPAFEAAVNKAIAHHTIFRTVLSFNNDGQVVQYIDDTTDAYLKTINCTEEEFIGIKEQLNKPFRLIGNPLIYLSLYETESKLYLFFMSHHIMIDGMGINTVLNSIAAFYSGKEPPMDMFFSYLDEEKQQKSSKRFLDSKRYFEEKYGIKAWCNNLTPTKQVSDNLSDGFSIVTTPDKAKLKYMEEKYHLTKSGICAAIALLTLHDCENKNDVMINWVFHNRTNSAKENSSGLMIKLLPIGVTVNDSADYTDVLKDVSEQITKGIANSAYDWCLENEEVFVNDALFMVYESSILDMPAMKQFGAVSEFIDDPTHTIIRRTSMQILDIGDDMYFMFYYLAGVFSTEKIAKFKSSAEKYIRAYLKNPIYTAKNVI